MKQGHLYFLFIVTWNREAPVSSIPGALAGLSVPCWHHWDWSSHSEKCQQILLLGNVFLLSKWGQSRGGGAGKKKGKRNGAEWAVQAIPDCGVALGVFNIRHRSLWAEACASSPGNRRDNCRTLKIKEGESLCSESGAWNGSQVFSASARGTGIAFPTFTLSSLRLSVVRGF